uniref:C2 domain-containing protein n=1 Tax=Nothoprocta perdicaria TaxID=30464 RepID=A0A8C6YYN9_NOTPE
AGWAAWPTTQNCLVLQDWACQWYVKYRFERKETHPYYNLTVKILKARNIHGLDLLSKANCYVAVDLPTASPLTSRTHLVYNCSDPEWNEIPPLRSSLMVFWW